jgi:hypothetical protein
MRKLISIVLVVLLLSTYTTAFARASDQLASYSITVTPRGSGVVRVTATVNGTHNNMTCIGFPEVALFEWSGSKWVEVDCKTGVYKYYGGSNSCQFDYAGTTGNHYYAAARFYAKDANGEDERFANSVSKQAT